MACKVLEITSCRFGTNEVDAYDSNVVAMAVNLYLRGVIALNGTMLLASFFFVFVRAQKDSSVVLSVELRLISHRPYDSC